MRDAAQGRNGAPMPDPLVARKIVVPTSRGAVVPRPRLFRLLEDGSRYPLVTVVAPAGWGKTTLLSTWLQQPADDRVVAWLSVDGEDDDPVRFWSHVITTMAHALALHPDHALSTMRPTRATSNDARFVAEMIDVLAALPEPVCLMIDDVHEIGEPSIPAALTYLVAHAPPNFRLVLSGRFLPGIPLGRMRVLDEVLEINAAALAFTDAELSSVLDAAGHEVAPADTARLLQRTEGWPAGVRLAELAMSGTAGPPATLTDLTGEEAVVAEYFINEVFDRQDPVTREFLLLTCVADTLTADLADALTGRADSEQLLETMARTNTLIGIQGRRPWYRYHQLFAETLRSTLRRDDPQLMRAQHRTAARWHAARGDPVAAVRHAVDGGDLATARLALGRVWLRLVLDGELTTLTRVLDLLPRNTVSGDAELVLVRAVLHLESGRDRLAQADVETGEQLLGGLDGTDRTRAAAVAATVRLRLAQLGGDIHAARHAGEAVLASPALEVDDPLRAMALLALGVCEYFTGRRGASQEILREGLRIARTTGHDYLVTGFLSQLAVVLTAQDRPVEAVDAAQEAVELAQRRGWGATPQMAVTWHALGWAHFLWNRLDEADLYLDRAELAAPSGDAALLAAIHMVQGLVQSLRRNRDAALALLAAAEGNLGDVIDRFVFRSYIRAEVVRLLVATGRLDEADRRLAPHRGGQRSVGLAVAEAELARARGDVAGALAVVGSAPGGTGSGFLDQHLQARVLTAVLTAELGRPDDADRVLEDALDLALPGDYRQPFLQFDAARALLEAHRGCPAHRRFVADLLGSDDAAVAGTAAPGAEVLSDREAEVLGHLAAMLTAAEIGAEMFVSVNTVKTHLKNVYRKLGVSSRRQAVARGVALGIVRPGPGRG
ncbi:LuxR family transcriptional regulator [Pseudonocardia sulfidoxydans NBRC 16205]|uniref:LuxR family transcriptional regulator n=1 Tax=Pseudonocardia sulfidoxydans NBRC 16205 TaxID=1223511 RepID=A0A511DFU6_9PSEU|nr:LuxR C-terminal-related transcriptional regulator [Pseudonocardia sulfidoxydans]GEL23661.1 LuxR family transcriptional regulator [Pseudonocardia sulfidoxydans NBRC 16205]